MSRDRFRGIKNMDKLRYACEEWLGKSWKIIVDSKGYTVEYVYEENNYVPRRSCFKSVSLTDITENIITQGPYLREHGKML
jgi:hypothetical protein